MAAAPRERRKPVSGLPNLPSTRAEWHEMANLYLANARLRDICSFGRFSASTVTKEAFLTVRCVWDNSVVPPDEALGYIIATGAFFSQEHWDDARQFLNRKLLGSKQLSNLFDIVCLDAEKKTPPRFQCSVTDGLGPFSMLVNLHKQIAEKSLSFARDGDLDPPTYAPIKPRSAPPPSSGSPTSRTPKRTRRSSPIVEDDPRSSPDPLVGPVNQITSPRPEIHPRISNELPDEVPDPRTPTETLVVNFTVTLLGGIACMVQRLSSSTLCVANSYETTYQFGPIAVNPPKEEIKFRARIDGSIPFSKPEDMNLLEMVIFEAKRDPRTPDRGVAVRGQQSMEHVAYIWERHVKERASIKPGVYRTFMISQDCLSFYISIGTYDDEYLNYIFGPGNAPVIPTDNRRNGFLHIQELGPFETEIRREMEVLAQIILCLTLWQLDGKPEASMIKTSMAGVRPDELWW
ncbi:hypothetical protein AJ79_01438 [Helicocarpus griseus UAMH5409]|uniref:Uncharacterized protein n=1 Tax=Helicocarpus griseus UAMH5409 TaxID=1447875 RepID=A0A2B7XZ23_9EURO|nr:hypothetical protein AJ79_01438 [Helicocarpus griseus UAMH5409]